MKTTIGFILLLTGFVLAQDPTPLPPAAPGFDWSSTNTLSIKWDHIPNREMFRAEDADGNELHLLYRVYHSVAVTGPWAVAATTTNNTATISNLVLRTHFFYVTSVNPVAQQTESEPSAKLSSPVEKVLGTRLVRP